MTKPYQVYFVGSMYAYGLYGPRGEQYTNEQEAAQSAENQYGADWCELCTECGQTGTTREEWLESQKVSR